MTRGSTTARVLFAGRILEVSSTQRLLLWLPYTVSPCLQTLQPLQLCPQLCFAACRASSKGLCLAKVTEVSISLLILPDVIYLL